MILMDGRNSIGKTDARAVPRAAPRGVGRAEARAVPGAEARAVEARKLLFLMVEVARKNFRGREEVSGAVVAAFCVLAGKRAASEGDMRAIWRELER